MSTTTPTVLDREVLAVRVALQPIENDSRLRPVWRRLDERREFDADEVIENGGWSSGERVLIEFAGALWKGAGTVDIGYIASALSDRFLHACLGALAAYAGRDFPGFTADGSVRR